jgi:hypothetical protein
MFILKNIKSSLSNLNRLRKEARSVDEFKAWADRQYAAPSPTKVKHQVILRNGIPNAIWIETGTYKGDTSKILAKNAQQVFTLEPAEILYEAAASRFKAIPNINVIFGSSEEVFPNLLPKVSGEVNFWLDGHYSTGITYQGQQDCPLIEELIQIEKNISNFSQLVIMIDDIRYCINPKIHQFTGYPKIDFFVDWAKNNDLYWHIEHDIFIIKSKSLYQLNVV